jgi:hypothetical protein
MYLVCPWVKVSVVSRDGLEPVKGRSLVIVLPGCHRALLYVAFGVWFCKAPWGLTDFWVVDDTLLTEYVL